MKKQGGKKKTKMWSLEASGVQADQRSDHEVDKSGCGVQQLPARGLDGF